MNSPLVTISFPVYNVEKYVKQSLLSVLKQDYKNIEILIIDDCGDDRSMEIVRSIVQESGHENIKLIELAKNEKQGYGRNISIEKATGQYIFFMDSDDFLLPSAISILVGLAETSEADIIVGSHNSLEGEFQHNVILNDKVLKGGNCIFEYEHFDKNYYPVYMWNKLYRIDFLKTNKIRCSHPYIEDDFFQFQASMNATCCVLTSKITYKYNFMNPLSTTSTLMSSVKMEYETARIHVDIVEKKILQLKNFGNQKLKNLILIKIIGQVIYHLYFAKASMRISKSQYITLRNQFLNNPFQIKLRHVQKGSFGKLLYYWLFSWSPIFIKVIFCEYVNTWIYRLKKIMASKKRINEGR